MKAFIFPYCKFQTVFTPSCFPRKHLLSYYHGRANVADVRGSIYMTIPSAPEGLYGFVVAVFPTGTLVPFPKCFQVHIDSLCSAFACSKPLVKHHKASSFPVFWQNTQHIIFLVCKSCTYTVLVITTWHHLISLNFNPINVKM